MDAIGARLYLTSWEKSVSFSDIQALRDDQNFGKYFTGEFDFDVVYTVTAADDADTLDADDIREEAGHTVQFDFDPTALRGRSSKNQ